MKKRGTENIIKDFLIVLKNKPKCNQTHIILKCNISSILFNNYKEMLIQKGLISFDVSEYELTLKGYNLVTDLENIKKKYGLFEK